MPIIAVNSSNASDAEAPKFNSDYYALAYADLFARIIRMGGQPVVVYESESNYLGEGRFRTGWFARMEGERVIYEKVDDEFVVDLLYDKNRFPFEDLRKINPNSMLKICNDKYLSYLFAADDHAKSFLVENEAQLEMFLRSHDGEKVALKELDGSGGVAVYVGLANDYQKTLRYPLLAQEFIDTSGGVAGLASGVHDVRVGMFSGEAIMAYLRVPQAQELRSNQFLGGTGRAVRVEDIPGELVELTRKLDRRFGTREPRFFAADWGFDDKTKTWKLFELNGAPGLEHESEDGEVANEFLEKLAEKLIESTKGV